MSYDYESILNIVLLGWLSLPSSRNTTRLCDTRQPPDERKRNENLINKRTSWELHSILTDCCSLSGDRFKSLQKPEWTFNLK